MLRFALVSFCLFNVVAAGIAPAQTVVLNPLRDGTLYQDAAGALANGSGTSLFAGLNNMLGARRGILDFDVAAAVPAGSVICSAVLRLDSITGGTTTIPVAVHRVTADWGEGASVAGGAQGGGGPSATGDATWIHRFYPGSFWGAAGGDFVATASASTNVGGFATWSWTGPGLVADVQSMLDQPANDHGWILKSPETLAGTVKGFAARESATASVRPRLEIGYLAPVLAFSTFAGGGCPASPFAMGTLGAPSIGNGAFGITFIGGPPGGQPLIYLSTGIGPWATIVGPGCGVVLDLAGVASYVAAGSSPIAAPQLDGAGAAVLPCGVPPDPCLVGFQIAIQTGCVDPVSANLFISNGVLLTVGL